MTDNYTKKKKGLAKLSEIMRRLRSPDGCPWDKRQSKRDIGKYLLDEAYEVVEALEQGTAEDQKEELGDLLFQIVFVAHLAEEEGEFSMADVIDGIAEKMIRRHPHVFGSVKLNTVDEVKANWEDIKKNVEKKDTPTSQALGKINSALPALMKAQKITEKAAKVRFDWDDAKGVFDKITEEMEELRAALNEDNKIKIAEEMGDVLFSIVNLCRFSDLNAEDVLNRACRKFIRRFSYMEEELARQGISFDGVSAQELDRLWNKAKSTEKKAIE